jgi:hypothetical protein
VWDAVCLLHIGLSVLQYLFSNIMLEVVSAWSQLSVSHGLIIQLKQLKIF